MRTETLEERRRRLDRQWRRCMEEVELGGDLELCRVRDDLSRIESEAAELIDLLEDREP